MNDSLRQFSGWELVRGVREAPSPTVQLRAGSLTLTLDGIEIRNVRFGDVEVVRRLQVAVRDEKWGTVPAVIESRNLIQTNRSFQLTFHARHLDNGLDYSWRGQISGTADGELSYLMDGKAESSFDYGRIGIVALHPPGISGHRYVARSNRGSENGLLPKLIGSQQFIDGVYKPLIGPYQDLDLRLANGTHVAFHFEGDEFEMEDQRNWTDASFKTYSTPLSRGLRHTAAAGSTLTQQVTMSATKKTGAKLRTNAPIDSQIQIGGPLSRRLPHVGFSLPLHGPRVPAHQMDLLAMLEPDHVRVNLVDDTSDLQQLELASATALSLGASVELALSVDQAGVLADRHHDLLGRAHVARIMVVEGAKGVAGREEVNQVRRVLGGRLPNASICGGTAGQFVALNLAQARMDGVDGIGYSITPQMHAFDDISIIENLEAQADTVRSAKALAGRAPVIVGPVTLRPQSARFSVPGPLPSGVDPRQMSLLGAAWTLGSLSQLSGAGASSITYYELNGWRGLLELPDGPPEPTFPSHPGMLFPLFHVFAALAGWRKSRLLQTMCSQGSSIGALALRRGRGDTRILVSNLRNSSQTVKIALPQDGYARVAMIDDTIDGVTTRADLVQSDLVPVDVVAGTIEVYLRPYAAAVVDVTLG